VARYLVTEHQVPLYAGSSRLPMEL
jgi:hypothetical protein